MLRSYLALGGRRPLRQTTIAALTALAILTVLAGWRSTGRAAPAMDWNDYAIRWQPYTLALSMAKRENKPILLVVYTQWCPHCAAYSKVFHDPRVLEKSKELVMVRIDADKDPALADKFAPDGKYVPRTFLLSPDGDLAPEIHEDRDSSKHFLNSRDPGSVLAAMDRGLDTLR